MKLSQDQIEVIKDYFRTKPVLRAFVFGSYSRDEATPDSDLDILVELDYSQHIGLGFIAMKQDLENRLNTKVDLVSSNALTQRIAPFVSQDKQLIYEK